MKQILQSCKCGVLRPAVEPAPACRAAGIAVRFPSMDGKIIMYCLNLRDKLKINANTYKVALRKSVDKILPPEILQRKPAGLSMPIRYWFSKSPDSAVNIQKIKIAQRSLDKLEINQGGAEGF